MTKRKFNIFVDIVTVLVILFPLIMALITARNSGTFDGSMIADYVQNFAISTDLSNKIGECVNSFGIALNGAFFGASCTILGNALLVYVFRVFIAVMTFIPKFAIRLLDIRIGDEKI